MKGFIGNLEKLTAENDDFRRVLYTARHSQLVLMSLLPGEDIGEEIHELDQLIRVSHSHSRGYEAQCHQHGSWQAETLYYLFPGRTSGWRGSQNQSGSRKSARTF